MPEPVVQIWATISISELTVNVAQASAPPCTRARTEGIEGEYRDCWQYASK